MAEDDHAKYRPDDDDGDDEEKTERTGSSRDEKRNGEYVHAPAVDVTEFEADETRETDRDGRRPEEREADRPDGSAADEPDESAAKTTGPDPADVGWTGPVGHAAGVETPVPRNLTASIVAVFAILGGGMAILGLLFAGIDLVVLDSFQLQVSLLSPEILVAAIPAQAGVVAVIAGFYAGTREEGTEAVVAAAAGTFLGVVVEVVLVTAFVSASANLVLRMENLVLTAAFLGIVMAGVTAGSAILYGRYVTHPDGLLGALSDRLTTEERRGGPSRTRK